MLAGRNSHLPLILAQLDHEGEITESLDISTAACCKVLSAWEWMSALMVMSERKGEAEAKLVPDNDKKPLSILKPDGGRSVTPPLNPF